MIFSALVSLALLGQSSKPGSYSESITNTDGTVEMRTLAQKLVAPGKPDIWLVGAVHVGKKEYYGKIQKLLDAQGTVLFEGVKQTEGSSIPEKPDPNSPKPIYMVLSDAIGLDFQLNDIDYHRRNWIDSDLTWDQIMTLNDKASKGKPNEMTQIKSLLKPGSPDANLFANFVKGATPGTREAFKLMIVKGIAAGMGPSLDPSTTEVVVEERNKSVMSHLKPLMTSPTKPRSIAIFYGALHLPGLQHDLADRYGYKPAEQQWFTSATADPKKLDATGKTMLDAFQKMTIAPPKPAGGR